MRRVPGSHEATQVPAQDAAQGATDPEDKYKEGSVGNGESAFLRQIIVEEAKNDAPRNRREESLPQEQGVGRVLDQSRDEAV